MTEKSLYARSGRIFRDGWWVANVTEVLATVKGTSGGGSLTIDQVNTHGPRAVESKYTIVLNMKDPGTEGEKVTLKGVSLRVDPWALRELLTRDTAFTFRDIEIEKKEDTDD